MVIVYQMFVDLKAHLLWINRIMGCLGLKSRWMESMKLVSQTSMFAYISRTPETTVKD